MYIGTAGWSIASKYCADLPIGGSHLERYAKTLSATEINSSFYKPHKRATYERWARSVPSDFRFSVKIPKAISHENALKDCGQVLKDLLADVSGLGTKHGVWLLQLPPKHAFDESTFRRFTDDLRRHSDIPVAVEPRHLSWFMPEVEECLIDCQVARVATDPVRSPEGRRPGGWDGLRYFRWHGSPRMYYSDYDATALQELRKMLAEDHATGGENWCFFDNTALGAALGNAIAVTRNI